MIITTLSSSTLLALMAYGFLTIIPNKCSAQIDTTLHLEGGPYRLAGLAITIPSRSINEVASTAAKGETVAVFPCVSIPMLLSYFPDADTEYFGDEGTSISERGGRENYKALEVISSQGFMNRGGRDSNPRPVG
jgi:hypothetical protein